jgi:hypothetical protein
MKSMHALKAIIARGFDQLAGSTSTDDTCRNMTDQQQWGGLHRL